MQVEEYQKQFRQALGSEPEKAIETLAQLSGYSRPYLKWVAGMIGRRPWPGSKRFVKRMQALGFDLRPWRDRTPAELARAFQTREVLHPNGRGER